MGRGRGRIGLRRPRKQLEPQEYGKQGPPAVPKRERERESCAPMRLLRIIGCCVRDTQAQTQISRYQDA